MLPRVVARKWQESGNVAAGGSEVSSVRTFGVSPSCATSPVAPPVSAPSRNRELQATRFTSSARSKRQPVAFGYSARNTTVGSTRLACLAGRYAAALAATITTNMAAARVTGSSV